MSMSEKCPRSGHQQDLFVSFAPILPPRQMGTLAKIFLRKLRRTDDPRIWR